MIENIKPPRHVRPIRFALGGLGPSFLALGLLASACGSGASDTATEAPAADATGAADTVADPMDDTATNDAGPTATASISIKDFSFSGDMAVAPGTVITVTNNDGTAHTLTSADGAFDTGTLAPGESAPITVPDDTGDFAFFCSIHPSMTGTLVVGS